MNQMKFLHFLVDNLNLKINFNQIYPTKQKKNNNIPIGETFNNILLSRNFDDHSCKAFE